MSFDGRGGGDEPELPEWSVSPGSPELREQDPPTVQPHGSDSRISDLVDLLGLRFEEPEEHPLEKIDEDAVRVDRSGAYRLLNPQFEEPEEHPLEKIDEDAVWVDRSIAYRLLNPQFEESDQPAAESLRLRDSLRISDLIDQMISTGSLRVRKGSSQQFIFHDLGRTQAPPDSVLFSDVAVYRRRITRITTRDIDRIDVDESSEVIFQESELDWKELTEEVWEGLSEEIHGTAVEVLSDKGTELVWGPIARAWIVPDPGGPIPNSIEGIVDAQQSLHDILIGDPLSWIGVGMGVPHVGVLVMESIGDGVPLPSDNLFKTVKLTAEICGMVVGSMTGNPILVGICMKALVHDQIGVAINKSIEALLSSPKYQSVNQKGLG